MSKQAMIDVLTADLVYEDACTCWHNRHKWSSSLTTFGVIKTRVDIFIVNQQVLFKAGQSLRFYRDCYGGLLYVNQYVKI